MVDVVRRPKRRLPAWLDRALSTAVVPGDSQDTVRTKRLLTGSLWVSVPAIAISVIQLLVFEAPVAAGLIAVALIVSLGSLLALWVWPGSYPGVMHVVAGGNIMLSASLVVVFGGLLESGVNSVWGLVVLVGAVVVFGDWRANFWLGFYVVVTVLAAVWANQIEALYTLPRAEYVAMFNLMAVVFFVYGVFFYYVRQRTILLDQSDALLRNVLPNEVADRLKTSQETIAESFEAASILFADVAGFTPMSAGMTPRELVSLLDEVFSAFDTMVEDRELEKIKTIGDAYMVASGVPHLRPDHAQALCHLALDMRDHVASHSFQGRQLEFRIGINSGPVVAGIIGRHKFSYDLWGDSVNTASRMESSGSPGKIQITEATLRLVEDEFVCEPRGVVEVKGKGPMPVWHLMGRLDPAR
ncbi:MAG TPA: adenylate/guanylate cyclase domain-containing protein [Acidimicrobiia bacterium]|nr:adenylate/guanylate cyclase domain-containing protein [Acidimicrobiia bacterium]